MILNAVDSDFARRFTVAGDLVAAKLTLHTIASMHAADCTGICVVCDLGWPCRTYRVAIGAEQ